MLRKYLLDVHIHKFSVGVGKVYITWFLFSWIGVKNTNGRRNEMYYANYQVINWHLPSDNTSQFWPCYTTMLLQPERTWYSDWEDTLLESPVVHARTNTIFKVMKAIGIPHHDSFPNYFWDELCGSVAIFTNLQKFSYSERTTRNCVHEPKCNGQFLTMVTQMKCLFFYFHIMKNKFHKSHIPCIMVRRLLGQKMVDEIAILVHMPY